MLKDTPEETSIKWAPSGFGLASGERRGGRLGFGGELRIGPMWEGSRGEACGFWGSHAVGMISRLSKRCRCQGRPRAAPNDVRSGHSGAEVPGCPRSPGDSRACPHPTSGRRALPPRRWAFLVLRPAG